MNSLFLFVILMAFTPKSQGAIVDTNDWRSSLNGNDIEKRTSSATAAIVHKDSIKTMGNGQLVAIGKTFKDKDFCSDEKFADAIAVSDCSSVLVAPDVVLTGTHCLDEVNCQSDLNFLFDFTTDLPVSSAGDGFSKVNIKETSLFRCQKVLFTSPTDDGDDFALIKLDRKVEGRAPVSWRRSGEVAFNDRVFSVTNPAGMPQVIAPGKVVSVQDNFGKIISDYDSVRGQSGSPVFSSSGTLEGIHQGSFNSDVIVDSGPPPCRRWNSVSKEWETNAQFTSVSVMLDQLNRYASPDPEAGEGDILDETQN